MTARPNHSGRALQDVEGGNAPGHDTSGSSPHASIIRRLRIPSATIETKKTMRAPRAVGGEPASCGSMVPHEDAFCSPEDNPLETIRRFPNKLFSGRPLRIRLRAL